MSAPWYKQSADPQVLVEREGIGCMLGWGTLAQLPANGSAGWAIGALFNARDQVTGQNWYINTGSFASALFVLTNFGTSFSNNIVITANTGPNDFYFTDNTTKYLSFDARNTVTGVVNVLVTGNSPTIASAAGDTYSAMAINPATITLTGTTLVTAMDGVGLNVEAATITDSSAVTITEASNLYVGAITAGGSVTITNNFAAHFGGAVRIDGNISTAAQATSEIIIANTAAALVVTDGTTAMQTVDTRTTVGTAGAGGTTFKGQPSVLASAASAFNTATIYAAPRTNTLTGTTTTTSWLGSALYLDQQTWTDSSACTLTTVSSMHITANAAAGGSLTVTNSYMISTSVAGCFLTNAGVFTSTSTAAHKEEIEDAEARDIFHVLDQVKARAYRWKSEFDNEVLDRDGKLLRTEKIPMDDRGRRRYGLIAEELPDALRIPGSDATNGLPDGVVAAFAVAACKALREENKVLLARLEALEAKL